MKREIAMIACATTGIVAVAAIAPQTVAYRRNIAAWSRYLVGKLSVYRPEGSASIEPNRLHDPGDRATTTATRPSSQCLASPEYAEYRDRLFVTLVNIMNFGKRLATTSEHSRASECIAMRRGGALNNGYAGMEQIKDELVNTEPPVACSELHQMALRAAKAFDESLRICTRLEDAFSCRVLQTKNCVDDELMNELYGIAREESASLQRLAGVAFDEWLAEKKREILAKKRERAEQFLQ